MLGRQDASRQKAEASARGPAQSETAHGGRRWDTSWSSGQLIRVGRWQVRGVVSRQDRLPWPRARRG